MREWISQWIRERIRLWICGIIRSFARIGSGWWLGWNTGQFLSNVLLSFSEYYFVFDWVLNSWVWLIGLLALVKRRQFQLSISPKKNLCHSELPLNFNLINKILKLILPYSIIDRCVITVGIILMWILFLFFLISIWRLSVVTVKIRMYLLLSRYFWKIVCWCQQVRHAGWRWWGFVFG